jgi:hypothetical protein
VRLPSPYREVGIKKIWIVAREMLCESICPAAVPALSVGIEETLRCAVSDRDVELEFLQFGLLRAW